MERAERSTAHSVPIRESAPLTSSHPRGRSHDLTWASPTGGDGSQPSGADVWSGAIQRLQTQISLNTSMLESHRRQFSDLNHRVDALVQEMANATAAIHDLHNQLRAKPGPTTSSRHDLGDLDLLVGQVEAVTSKANEVDALKLQLDLMKRRVKRLEEQTDSSARSGLPPSPGHSMPPYHETSSSSHHSPYAHPHQVQHHQQQQPLPPMRTGSITSTGAPGHHTPPQPSMLGLENQGRSKYPPPTDPRHYPTENAPVQPSPLGGFRPSEPLPPPTSLPGWRASEPLSHSNTLPPPPPPAHSRPQALEPEPHAASGWASINAAQPAKRAFEEPRVSPYQSPGSGSPKRPKLAPIMPRSSYGDDPMAGQQHTERTASDSSQPQSSVAASTNGPSYRFITSTAPTEPSSQEPWRSSSEHERRMHGHHRHGHSHDHIHVHHHHGREHGHHGIGHGGRGGRGGRRGGGGRGRRARGGGVLIPGEGQELGAGGAEQQHQWEQRGEWVANPIAPNGYYHPLHPLSPRGGGGRGGGLGRRLGGAGVPSDRDGEQHLPDTPPHGSDDHVHGSGGGGESGMNSGSGGKKTRSKPIRNAEGILIRKDGRPDMRSVSSANNLRKVHAKKEAERAEMDVKPLTGGGAARSLAPARAYSEENGYGDGDGDGDEGEEENSNVTPSGTPGSREEQDEEGEGDGEDEEGQHRDSDRGDAITVRAYRDTTFNAAKRSNDDDSTPSARGDGRDQSADVVMQESSDAATDDHDHEHDDGDGDAAAKDQDTRMPTVEEESEEEEEEKSTA